MAHYVVKKADPYKSTVSAFLPSIASELALFMLVVVLGFFADFSSKKVNLA